MVIGGAHFMVNSAVNLAKAFGISEWVIGATVVAGTSAPEFATSLVAALRKRYGISVGNLIGSDIFNLFGVLGLAAILRDLPVDVGANESGDFAMMVALVLVFMRTGWVISKKEGSILVMMRLARWAYSFLVK